MDLQRHTMTPSTGPASGRPRSGVSVRGAGSAAAGLVWVTALLLVTGPALALDLPLLGKPDRGRNPPASSPANGLVPPGRQDDGFSDGRAAREAAREAQAINGGGRVLSVDAADGGWRVKLLKDGNVRFVFVPN